GSNLKVLAVSEESIDFDPDQSVFIEGDPVHNLVKEVSLGLGRVWHPSLDTSVVLSEPTQPYHRSRNERSATRNVDRTADQSADPNHNGECPRSNLDPTEHPNRNHRSKNRR